MERGYSGGDDTGVIKRARGGQEVGERQRERDRGEVRERWTVAERQT